MFKKILLVAALILPMLASAQTLKIGLVDSADIIQKMPETAAAQQQVNDVQKKYESEYKNLTDEMNRLVTEYKAMKPDELAAIKERKERDIEDYQQKIQQFLQNADQDTQTMYNNLMTPIIQKVRTAIEAVGKEGGYSMIQDKNPQLTIYYAAPVVDITPDVKAKLGIK